jgi:hypothetical protein
MCKIFAPAGSRHHIPSLIKQVLHTSSFNMAKKSSYGTNGTPFRPKIVEEDISETTRLLADTVNLARRAEDIGKDQLIIISRILTALCLLIGLYLETATFRELLEQGDTIRAAKQNVSIAFCF